MSSRNFKPIEVDTQDTYIRLLQVTNAVKMYTYLSNVQQEVILYTIRFIIKLRKILMTNETSWYFLRTRYLKLPSDIFRLACRLHFKTLRLWQDTFVHEIRLWFDEAKLNYNFHAFASLELNKKCDISRGWASMPVLFITVTVMFLIQKRIYK